MKSLQLIITIVAIIGYVCSQTSPDSTSSSDTTSSTGATGPTAAVSTSTSTAGPTTPSTTTVSTTTVASVCSGNGTTYQNKENCRQYYTCINGKKTLESCPKGKYYNCYTGSCTRTVKPACCRKNSSPWGFCFKIGAKTANPDNCNQYYQCVNIIFGIGYYRKTACPSGENFDAWKKTCMSTSTAICG